jgi:predicted RNA methylase
MGVAFETIFLIVELGLLTAAVFFFLRAIQWFMFGRVDAPFVPTPQKYAGIVVEALDVRDNDTVYELGSGDGRFILACAKLSPRSKYVGIEYNPLLHVIALIRKRVTSGAHNVEFRRGNFFDTDFSEADKLYAYLLTTVMRELEPKFGREFKGRVASRAFTLANKEPSSVIQLSDRAGAHGQHNLYVYDFE